MIEIYKTSNAFQAAYLSFLGFKKMQAYEDSGKIIFEFTGVNVQKVAKEYYGSEYHQFAIQYNEVRQILREKKDQMERRTVRE